MKFAIAVTHRNREEHLKKFLEHYGKLFPESDIYIMEHNEDRPFNKAKLWNIFFSEAGYKYDYTAYHDVDMLAVKQFDYSFPEVPTNLATHCSQFGWNLPYENYFGGVCLINRDDYKKVNGFSNNFWGYGGEDDEMYNNIISCGLPIKRRECYYVCLDHPRVVNDELYTQNCEILSKGRDAEDGLSFCAYSIVNTKKMPTHTLIKAKL